MMSSEPSPLTLAVAQPDSRLDDLEFNSTRHSELVEQAGARLVVFPEMSLTGYTFGATPVSPDDPLLAPIVTACGRSGSLALVGAPIVGEYGQPQIATMAIDGDGASVVYAKMHLSNDEAQVFLPGARPAVITVDSWRIGLAICKDTGVQMHAASTAALDMDIYVAGVLESRQDREVPTRRAVQIARSYGVWVAMASFAGPTGAGYFNSAGNSCITQPDGAIVASCGPEVAQLAIATIPRPTEFR